MPIAKALRHLYRGPEYKAFVEALRKRAKDHCEQCRKPNRSCVVTITGLNTNGLLMAWTRRNGWHDQNGRRITRISHIAAMNQRRGSARTIVIKLGPAHMNHTAGDFDLAHSRFLCQWCHLHYDQELHQAHAKETRLDRKDAARPLLQERTA